MRIGNALRVLEQPVVTDADGDGVVSPGEDATVHVSWRETLGTGINAYPGVKFSSTNDGMSVIGDDFRYAALPCHTDRFSTRVSVSPDTPVHTRVTVTARVATLGDECPTGDSLDIVFSVGDPLP